ncbi:MAG: type II toxin-antitoxin system prevent-host-death family antitoxin [Vicinamibacterales bacterium]
MTAADANRNFSELLREIRAGRSVVITVHGKPTAKLVPFDGEKQRAHAGRKALLNRLSGQRVVNAGRWKRESPYRDSK